MLIIGGLFVGYAIDTQTKVAASVPNPTTGALFLLETNVSDELVVDCTQENGNWVITLNLKEGYEDDINKKSVHIWEWSVYLGDKRLFWQRAAGWLEDVKFEFPYTGGAYIYVEAELIK